MKFTTTFFLLAGWAGLTSGCLFPARGSIYDRRAANQVQRVEYGTIEQVRNVTIAGQHSGIGVIGGAAVGGAAASGIGHGVGTALAEAGGVVVGAVAGDATEEALTRKAALELTIKLDSGNTIVVAQEVPPEFILGDRVRVVIGGGMTRVGYAIP
jgi:outer membrane lipoprotein SlyB